MSRLQRDAKGYSLEGRRLEAGDVILVRTGGNYHGITLPDPLPVRVVFDTTGLLRFMARGVASSAAREIEFPFNPEEDVFSWRSGERA